MTKTKADILYESLANFADEEGAIECGAKMRDYARELERENARLKIYNAQAEAAATQHKAESERLRNDLSMVVCAILKRNGKAVTDMTAIDRIRELHANELLFRAQRLSSAIAH